MRKLASIQRIWKIEPIEGADRLEKAYVEGWICVVNKGQFKPMDLAVYFEIDSFLPIEDRYEFLRASSYKNTNIMGEGFRLRTMKFRGQISQGLLLPLSTFSEIKDPKLGDDVTELLHVKKWEIEERATTGGTIMGNLPYNVPHTDEIRVQNFPEFVEAFKDIPYYITTKMDGSSHSLSIDENGFHVCGHNYEYKDDGASSFYEFIKKKNYRAAMEEYAKAKDLKTLTVQGEFCAPGIQSNRLKLSNPQWFVFTIMEDGERIPMDKLMFAAACMNMDLVPIEEVGVDLPSVYPTVEAILERADGQYPNGGPKEGIVIRAQNLVYNETIGGPLSMKAVSNKYLLKNE